MLETGKLPAAKVGKKWVADRHALRRHFIAALAGEAA
jgi:hypothetical protein